MRRFMFVAALCIGLLSLCHRPVWAAGTMEAAEAAETLSVEDGPGYVKYATSESPAMIAAQEKAWDLINAHADPDYFMNDPFRENLTEEQFGELRQAAVDVTAGCGTQYEKIKAITGFVADRIYYDVKCRNAAVAGKDYHTYTNPYDVYVHRRAVCDGIATLMRTLMIADGIPCMLLPGYDHSYNACYDSTEQRWIFADATWCCDNRYMDEEEWIYRGSTYDFFDLSPQEIAALSNHEIYFIEGLLDGSEDSVYYRLETDNDMDGFYNDMVWRKCDWHLEVMGAKEDEIKAAAGFAGFEVTVIRQGAFRERGDLRKADFSDTKIQSIGQNAFYQCTALESLQLPKTLSSFGIGTFSGCTSLKTLDLSQTGLVLLGNNLFRGLPALETVKLPATLTSVGRGTFSGCTSLRMLDFSQTKVMILESGLFRDLPELEEIKFPATLLSVGKDIFSGCSSLKTVDFSGTKIVCLPERIFYQCTSLESIQLPESLQNIWERAFTECSALKTVDLSQTGLMALEKYAFYGCDALTIIRLPSTLAEIGEGAFNCSNGIINKDTTVYTELSEEQIGYTKANTAPWKGRIVTISPGRSMPFELATKKVLLKKKSSYRLKVSSLPSGLSDKDVRWKSNKPKIVSVNAKGILKARGYGRAVITARLSDGSGRSAKCDVTVGYTIKYHLNGGKNHKKNPTIYYQESFSLKRPTRKGYVFKGWYTSKDFKAKTKVTKFQKKMSGDKVLYAKWVKKK